MVIIDRKSQSNMKTKDVDVQEQVHVTGARQDEPAEDENVGEVVYGDTCI